MKITKVWNKRYNKNKGLFDYIDIDLGVNDDNYYFTIIILGIGFDYGTKEGGFRFVNQWKEKK